MFLTMTMLLVVCVKIAWLMIVSRLVRYPEVRNASALATRSGVLARPSRPGSSPSNSISSRVNCSILRTSTAIANPPFDDRRLSRETRGPPRGPSSRGPRDVVLPAVRRVKDAYLQQRADFGHDERLPRVLP